MRVIAAMGTHPRGRLPGDAFPGMSSRDAVATLSPTLTEIGPVPPRDRSYSASRSVHFRLEIGRTPRRDRSASGSRSVVLRAEIGHSPRRDCGVSKHLRQGACFGCDGPRWGDSRGWEPYESDWTAPSRLRQCLRLPGVVGVAHSRALCISRNRGIMRNSAVSNDHDPAPMCTAPLTAHGSPTTTRETHQKSPQFQQKPAPTPQRPQSPMCNA